MAKKNNRQKIAKNIVVPSAEKTPKWKDPLVGGDEFPLAWRFSGCDTAGPYSWLGIEPPEKFREVMQKLHEFETKSWQDIIEGGSHLIQTHKLEKPARDRLAEIMKDDLDELMSFRLSGANRVWCIQSGHIMRVLWWDPDHSVYPVHRDPEDRRKKRNR